MTDNQIDDNEISSSENEGDEVDSDEEVYNLFLISRSYGSGTTKELRTEKFYLMKPNLK